MALEALRSDSIVAGVVTILSYGGILIGMFLVLFVIPYLLFLALG